MSPRGTRLLVDGQGRRPPGGQHRPRNGARSPRTPPVGTAPQPDHRRTAARYGCWIRPTAPCPGSTRRPIRWRRRIALGAGRAISCSPRAACGSPIRATGRWLRIDPRQPGAPKASPGPAGTRGRPGRRGRSRMGGPPPVGGPWRGSTPGPPRPARPDVGDAPAVTGARSRQGLWVLDPLDATVSTGRPAGMGPSRRPSHSAARPTAMVQSGGGVWLADPRNGTLLRLAPRAPDRHRIPGSAGTSRALAATRTGTCGPPLTPGPGPVTAAAP